jgi:hypothetical protein
MKYLNRFSYLIIILFNDDYNLIYLKIIKDYSNMLNKIRSIFFVINCILYIVYSIIRYHLYLNLIFHNNNNNDISIEFYF